MILIIFMFNLGPAENLFKRPYYELLKNALKSDGIIISQAGTAWMNMDQVYSTLQHCKAVFTFTAYATTAVPTYPTGQIGFVLGSLTKVGIKISHIITVETLCVYIKFFYQRNITIINFLN